MATDSYGMNIPLPPDATKIHEFPGVTRLAMERVAEILAGDLPQGVVDAVNAAAGTAVDAELDDAGVLRGAGTTFADAVAFSITDATGRRSWLEISTAGVPTTYAAKAIARALTPETLTAAGSTLPVPSAMSLGSGLAFAVVDSAGRKSELQIDDAGKFAGPFPARILAAAKTAADNAGTPLAPIVCWGDSLTAGGYPTTLANELGVATSNQGVGGQGIQSIAARQGGKPALITVPNNTIPASGPVTLSAITTAPYTSSSGTGTSSGHGTLAGVPGTLTRDNPSGVHTFTRDADGTAVWCAPKTAWTPDAAATYERNIAIIWTGRNSFQNVTAAAIVDHVRAMLDRMDGGRRRFLVLEIPPWVGEENGTGVRATLDAANAALQDAFPNAFVPIAQYLRGPALADGGIAATAQDNTDIANGITPTSLRSDGGHPTAAGQVLIGKYLAKIIRQKGWKLS